MSLDTGVPPTMAQLFPLFSTNIVVDQIANHEKFKEVIVPKLTESFKSNPDDKAPWASHCHTCQKIADNEGLDVLQTELQLAVEAYFAYLGCEPFKYEIRAWYNIHTSDMYQETHHHMSGEEVLSGIYYVQFDKEKDEPVVFVNNNNTYAALLEYKGLHPKFLAWHTDNTPDFSAKIQEGSLILFPPSTSHYAPRAKIQHDGLRISMSFNVCFLDTIEKVDDNTNN